ncbi:MAG TPA: helicase C-terminal domain-containing protein [Allosphingosinicella sp.]|nr:helicase C-terminal domain-containing protein [Allosphingosinicella sp.]
MTDQPITDLEAAAEVFVGWMGERVVARARGDDQLVISGRPSDRFWLGRLAPTHIAAGSGSDLRMERLEPCEIGLRFRLVGPSPWGFEARVSFVLWQRTAPGTWTKRPAIEHALSITVDPANPRSFHGVDRFAQSLAAATGRSDLGAEIACELSQTPDGLELLVSFVNTSSLDDGTATDPRFYQCSLAVEGLMTEPFELDSLEDTFRYDRRVAAYGVNCGVEVHGGLFLTRDAPEAAKLRPDYWGASEEPPDLAFSRVAADPVAVAGNLADRVRRWGSEHWSTDVLDARATDEGWTEPMRALALDSANAFGVELSRIEAGRDLLASDPVVRRAFTLMNEAMIAVGVRKGYDGWRPFQFGFLLANLSSLLEDATDADIVDIVWFATGGGKTETYLGLLTTAAFRDRLRGKTSGITAWSRFPLRMLSLQQMQRFADAMAAAEMVRRREGIGGDPFSVGFLVGNDASPNRIRRPEQESSNKYDPDDPSMPARFRMLQQCPFCGSDAIAMKFDFDVWHLDHRCCNTDCPWRERALPFHVVDEEVFRVLPTVVVGTLDKAASIGMQQAMRGLVGAPRGLCPTAGHGFTYNPSGKIPTGCLVPDCSATPLPLPFDGNLAPPTYRLQDELHLLRDALGAVDAHYEAALDDLQREITGRAPKILASSATLSGYEKQAEVLYRRASRVFPQAPPSPREGLWSRPGTKLMRRFLAIAPRGATIEFVVDRLINELQCAVRELHSDPDALCGSLGIDPVLAPQLLSIYGTDVVFGNTLRDLDAVVRSSGTQLVDIPGSVNQQSLTGRTGFESVSQILDKLQKTDQFAPFEERIHVITASSMMSHGVDVDRLNIMIVLGLPLTTAEFIQATARVGRKWPALVFIIHKIGRERDASVYRSFEKFVEQGDRFVEPIPITGRSRRVLERTLSGVEMGRLLHVHGPREPRFTTAANARQAMSRGDLVVDQEIDSVVDYLGYNAEREAEHIGDVRDGLERYFDRLGAPTTKSTEWIGNVWRNKPMMSLRDVEDQVTVHLRREP